MGFNVYDAIFKGAMKELSSMRCADIKDTLPKYWKAITDELLLAESGYFKEDKQSVELHCKKAIAYAKKASKILEKYS